MRNIKLVIEYDGTNYHGWQIQPNAVSIQETIEDRLQKITQEEIRLIAAGRTDAGVHAIEQVANFSTKSQLDLSNIQRGLNSMLPPDIVIKEISDAEQDFHARYSAKNKINRYVILNRRFPCPLYRNCSWFMPFKLNIKEMKEAAQCLIGEHDFSSFKASRCNSNNPIREVYGISIDKDTKGFIIFEIEANAFLKQMARNIVGTLADVGKGKIGVSEFEEILRAKDRKKAGITAPPQGLFLVKIKY